MLLVMIFEQFIPNITCIDREKAAVFITHCMRSTHLPIKNKSFSQKEISNNIFHNRQISIPESVNINITIDTNVTM